MGNGSFTYHSPSHGIISITDTALKTETPTLLLIHGNSSSSKIFKHMLASPDLTSTRRVITFDLPGHGASSNSENPTESYTMHGYAVLANEILEHLNIEKVVVLGWSLGGHIAVELIPLLPPGVLKGLVITGTPPCQGLDQTDKGFKFQDGHMSLAAQENLSEEQIVMFGRSMGGELFEPWMEDAVRRTHGKTRKIMWTALVESVTADQRKIVEDSDVLVAVINGKDEPFVNLEYLEEIKWRNLWKGKCVNMEGLGHTPFWEKPAEYEQLLLDFLADADQI